jgi:hypothetical protein
MNRGRKRRVRVGLYPYWTPLPPSPGKAVYVGSENGLGIGEGVPWLIGGGEWFPPHPPRGDGPAFKVSFIVTHTGPHPPGRRCVITPGAQPVAGGHQSEVSARGSWYLVWQGTIMHIIRLCVLVWEVSAGGHVNQERLPFSPRCGGRPLRHRQEVHQLVPEFDAGADQRRAVSWIETRCDSLGVDRVQLTLATQDHATGQSQPRGRQDRFIPRLPPLHASRAGVRCCAFESRHDIDIQKPTTISSP